MVFFPNTRRYVPRSDFAIIWKKRKVSKKTIMRAPSSGGLKGQRIHSSRSKHFKKSLPSGLMSSILCVHNIFRPLFGRKNRC